MSSSLPFLEERFLSFPCQMKAYCIVWALYIKNRDLCESVVKLKSTGREIICPRSGCQLTVTLQWWELLVGDCRIAGYQFASESSTVTVLTSLPQGRFWDLNRFHWHSFSSNQLSFPSCSIPRMLTLLPCCLQRHSFLFLFLLNKSVTALPLRSPIPDL